MSVVFAQRQRLTLMKKEVYRKKGVIFYKFFKRLKYCIKSHYFIITLLSSPTPKEV